MKEKITDFDQKHPILTFLCLVVICIVLIAAALISESVLLMSLIVVLFCSDIIVEIIHRLLKKHKGKNGNDL